MGQHDIEFSYTSVSFYNFFVLTLTLNFVNNAIFLCHIASTNILPKFLNHVVLLTDLAMHDNTTTITTSTILILESRIGEILLKNASLCLIAFPKVTALDIVGATHR
jgi:hypothetical protein